MPNSYIRQEEAIVIVRSVSNEVLPACRQQKFIFENSHPRCHLGFPSLRMFGLISSVQDVILDKLWEFGMTMGKRYGILIPMTKPMGALQGKQKQLDRIAEEIEKCVECKNNKEGVTVVGEGNPDATIMFIGEAPGRLEAETGRPFVGRSGQLLRGAIRDLGLMEEDVYITSPVKRLPTYKTPKPKDIEHGMTHLQKQIDIIEPRVIVLLGNTAARGVLGKIPQTSKDHGTFIEQNGKTYFFSYHPAAAIRFVKYKKVFLDDFQKLKPYAR